MYLCLIMEKKNSIFHSCHNVQFNNMSCGTIKTDFKEAIYIYIYMSILRVQGDGLNYVIHVASWEWAELKNLFGAFTGFDSLIGRILCTASCVM